jgi:hypothetical protein
MAALAATAGYFCSFPLYCVEARKEELARIWNVVCDVVQHGFMEKRTFKPSMDAKINVVRAYGRFLHACLFLELLLFW